MTTEMARAKRSALPPTALSRNGCWALALMWAYLLSPLAFRIAKGNPMGATDPLMLFNVGTSVLWVLVLHFMCRRPFVLHLLMLPFYVSTAVDLFLLTTFDARLASGYITIALADHSEAGDFILAYWPQILPQVVLCAAVAIATWRGLIGTVKPAKPHVSVVALVLIVAAYTVVVGRDMSSGENLGQGVLDLMGKEQSSPMGAVFQAALSVSIHQQGEQARKGRAGFSFDAQQTNRASGPQVVVWVVGESARPDNWSLFGYARDTTPLLGKQPGVIGFPHMTTIAPHTAYAVPGMFSLRPIADWPGIVSNKSIIAAFREAGFSTTWLSAQEADSWGGFIPQMAAEAERRRYFERTYDGALLPEFEALLAQRRPEQKLFIVLHTKGSHFEFSRRVPEEFRRFASHGGTRRERLINSYDDTIAYTDWFLNQLIEAMAKRQLSAALIYASDHGENLLDDSRQLFGHALGTEYDLRTASLMWFSDQLKLEKPAAFEMARRHADEKLSLSDLPHSALQLAGIEADGVDPSKSIFSETYAVRKRCFILRGTLKCNDHGSAVSARSGAAP